MKTCSKCGKTKALEAFNREAKGRNGHSHKCRVCTKEYMRLWREQNKDRLQAYMVSDHARRAEYTRQWRALNTERYHAYRPSREKSRADQVAMRKRLGRAYVIRALIQGTNFKWANVTDEMVEFKRQHLRLVRLIKEKRK